MTGLPEANVWEVHLLDMVITSINLADVRYPWGDIAAHRGMAAGAPAYFVIFRDDEFGTTSTWRVRLERVS